MRNNLAARKYLRLQYSGMPDFCGIPRFLIPQGSFCDSPRSEEKNIFSAFHHCYVVEGCTVLKPLHSAGTSNKMIVVIEHQNYQAIRSTG